MESPLPQGITMIRAPEEDELLEISRRAEAAHLHLVTDGRRTFLTPVIMPGYHRLGVSVKEAA